MVSFFASLAKIYRRTRFCVCLRHCKIYRQYCLQDSLPTNQLAVSRVHSWTSQLADSKLKKIS